MWDTTGRKIGLIPPGVKAFGINIFPSDVYYLEKMPSEINITSVSVVFFLSLIITSLASYFPAKTISKMKTTDALKYE